MGLSFPTRRLGIVGANAIETALFQTRRIIDEFRHRYGDSKNADIIALSLYAPPHSMPCASPTVDVLTSLIDTLIGLGAESVMVCSSALQVTAAKTSHERLFPSLADITTAALQKAQIRQVGLVGTQQEDEERFWRRQLAQGQVTDVFLPTTRDREHLWHIVTTELERGMINESSRADLVRIVYSLRQAGARALVLASPALLAPLLGAPPMLPLFDAAELAAIAAVDWALAREGRPTLGAVSQA